MIDFKLFTIYIFRFALENIFFRKSESKMDKNLKTCIIKGLLQHKYITQRQSQQIGIGNGFIENR
jgi:hypothetical protein